MTKIKNNIVIDFNNNFLNNQNYILGNNERRKISVKVFTEKSLNNFLVFLFGLNKIFEKKIIFFSVYFTFIFFQFFLGMYVLDYQFGTYIYNNSFFYLILIPVILLLFLYSISFNKPKLYSNSLLTLKDYFTYNGKINLFFYLIIFFNFTEFIFLSFFGREVFSGLSDGGIVLSILIFGMGLGGILGIGMILLFLIGKGMKLEDSIDSFLNKTKKYFLLRINYINIIFFLIFIFYGFYKAIENYILIFLKLKNNFVIKKLSINTNLTDKLVFGKNKAFNNYYLIDLK